MDAVRGVVKVTAAIYAENRVIPSPARLNFKNAVVLHMGGHCGSPQSEGLASDVPRPLLLLCRKEHVCEA